MNLISALVLRHSALFFWAPRWLDLVLSSALVSVALWWRYRFTSRQLHEIWRRYWEVCLLGALTVLAFAVRRAGLYFGLPFCTGVDEEAVVYPATRIITTGDLNPHFFHYPSFGYYLAALTLLIGYFREAGAGVCAHFGDLPSYVPYYYARLLSAVSSAATVPVVYAIGRRVATKGAAAIGALLIALSPVSVAEGRLASFHSIAPLLVALALWALLEFVDLGSTYLILAAGALAGLAVSTMYYCASLVPVVVAGALLGARKQRIVLAACALAATTAGFFAVSPYALLDLGTFATQFGERIHMAVANVGWGIGSTGGTTALQYAGGLVHGFGYAAGLFFTACALADIAAFHTRRLLLFGFVFLHLGFVGAYPSGFGRYMGPAVPIYALLAAHGLVRVMGAISQWLPRKASIGIWVASMSLFFFSPVRSQIRWLHHYRAPSAPAQARAWIDANIDAGAAILLEERTPFLPQRYTRAIRRNRAVDTTASDLLRVDLRYLLLSRSIYTRNLENEARYDRLLRRLDARRLAVFDGNDVILNPTIEIYQVGAAR
ncbi:MAG: glycosyltransferase family 39 protein [Acidobacteriota bacterium]